MKLKLILLFILFIIGCKDYCSSHFQICSSKGFPCRCATEVEKQEIMSNPEINQYVNIY